MPQYEYICTNAKCSRSTKRWTLLRSFTDTDALCPDCFQPAERCVVPSSPASFRMGGAK
ncbi:hypothetical protein LCGC14_2763430 [marine sediment metagenome]|uniref:Uncharacterized protein n=1 Tax=marine sediment metagenome TaxID=412755 RepID=A0A0F8YYD7_9ZZZZ